MSRPLQDGSSDISLKRLMERFKLRSTNKSSPKTGNRAKGAATPYSTLQKWEIRVLELQPGPFDAPLLAKLEHVHLKSPNGKARKHRSPSNFEAISYVWGSSEKPYVLSVPGKGDIPITESLYWVLKYFRLQDRSRRLWADAVCIDQVDIQERNSQVAIMGDIYGTCNTVLAWLGIGEDSDALAFATMQAIQLPENEMREEPYSFDDIVRSMKDSQFWKQQTHGIADAKSAVLKGLCTTAELTNRTWFHRLWTAQEAHNSIARKTLICSGRHVVDGNKFHSALLWAQRCRNDLPTSQPFTSEDFHAADDLGGTPDFVDINDSLQNVLDFLTFDRFLAYSARACSDPADRIFATRKILGLDKVAALKVDYDVDPAVLYRDFMTAILQSDKRTGTVAYHILATVGTENDETVTPRLPSWVPDLHNLSPASRLERARHWNRGLAVYKLDPTLPNELQLPGRCFAVCQEQLEFNDLTSLNLDQALPSPESIEASVRWYISLRNIVRSVSPSYGFENAMPSDSFFNYPTPYINLGRGGTKWLPEAIPSELRTTSLRHILDEDEAFDNEVFWRWLHWAILAMPRCPVTKLRRMWRIQNGDKEDLAWLPPRTSPGDHVCYFAGSPYPFVLRRCNDRMYTLIGDGDVLLTGIGDAIGSDLDDGQLDKQLFRENWRVKASSPTPWPDKFKELLLERLDWITLF